MSSDDLPRVVARLFVECAAVRHFFPYICPCITKCLDPMRTVRCKLLLLVAMLLVASAALAQTYTVGDVPNVRLKDKRMHVSDPEGVLERITVQSIDAMLAALEDSTSIEVAVVVVPSVPDGDCFTFAHQLGQQWGVGKMGRDNGLVVLLATEDRCVQMVTGYGLEGDLPDAICKRIQTQWMNPHFARGEWNEGLFYGVKAVCDRLQGTMSPDAEGEGGSSGFAWIFIGGILAVIVIGIVASRISDWRSRKCPRGVRDTGLQGGAPHADLPALRAGGHAGEENPQGRRRPFQRWRVRPDFLGRLLRLGRRARRRFRRLRRGQLRWRKFRRRRRRVEVLMSESS